MMTTKIDFHTHILPEIDDGASSADMSVAMLQKLSVQGVTHVVLSPHYYSHRKPIDRFLNDRKQAYQTLISSNDVSVQLHLGAEVYFSDYLFNNDDLSMLCIDDTDLMLLELPYDKTIDNVMMDKIDRLVCEYAVTPVIAHVERYPSLIRHVEKLDRLIDCGCLFQYNLSSFTGLAKRRLLSLMKNGYVHALGTDAHNLDSRPPEYNQFYERIEQSLSPNVTADIQQTMCQLLHV